MILEIEKMKNLQEKVETNQKKEIDSIIDTISADFEEMIHDTRHFLITGEIISRDFSNSITAIKRLKSLGDKNGIEFPEVNTNKEAVVYILQFGRQIINEDK